jgi:hypothetical protein
MYERKDSRTDFNESWLLLESPMGISPVSIANNIIDAIQDRVRYGSSVIDLGNGFKFLDGTQIVYYWYEDIHHILIAAEFEKRQQTLVVTGIDKVNKGQYPFASDLYNAVLNDRKHRFSGEMNSIRIMSDDKLSEEGLNIWLKLLALGHKVSVYNAKSETPGQTFTEINTIEEIQQYFKMHDNSFKRWQYVLSESGPNYAETRSFFLTRKMRELHNML